MKKNILISVLLLSVYTCQAMDLKNASNMSLKKAQSEKQFESHSLLEKYVPGTKLVKKIIIAGTFVCLFGGVDALHCSEIESRRGDLQEKLVKVSGVERYYGESWCGKAKGLELGVNCFPLGPATDDKDPCFDDDSCTAEQLEDEIAYLEKNVELYRDFSGLLDVIKVGNVPEGHDIEISGVDIGRTRRKFPKQKKQQGSRIKDLLKKIDEKMGKTANKKKTDMDKREKRKSGCKGSEQPYRYVKGRPLVEDGGEADCVENAFVEGASVVGKNAKVGEIRNVIGVGKSFNSVDDFIRQIKKKK